MQQLRLRLRPKPLKEAAAQVVLSNGVYRQHLADHAGTVIVHCHWLSHEDLGCMGQFMIESCATDDPASGVLGTCSTDEALGLEAPVIALIVVLVVLAVGAAAVAAHWCWRSKGEGAAPQAGGGKGP